MISKDHYEKKPVSDKDRKYSDEGRDGDYNTPRMNDSSFEEGDEDYDDEEEALKQTNHSANEGSGGKDERDSYISYDGNNDNTPPSR